MNHVKIAIIIIFISMIIVDYAPGQSSTKELESEKIEALLEKIKTLEESIAKLRSEIASIEKHFKNNQGRPPLSSYNLPAEMTLCGEKIPLQDRNIWENLDREFIVTLDNHAQILLWMKRVRRYFPHIEKRLKEMNLPDDLKYVTITESGLRPHAVSSSGAAGIWQFIPSTGEKYGMRRNKVLDERFDFFKATEGALNYLKSLYEEFGSWALAMAAYNAGENRIRKEIEVQKTRDYFYLDLPLETERYVYKVAVAKIILSDPGKYGFSLENSELYDPLKTERVQIELKQLLPIMEVARAIGFYYKDLKEMNLHLPDEVIPAGIHFLNLPSGTSERFWSFFNNWKKDSEKK
ncbi:MAG: lytic transglycosylase domain-containing protein [Deltaproteobacteria bacterium]|nr:lytic transglycosylase domain-containing protein [Deltaproteobacteria bacterium]MBM4346740.1 lytic transglycosylase domain-containing protein [Deltaproteobacteria bacterium]